MVGYVVLVEIEDKDLEAGAVGIVYEVEDEEPSSIFGIATISHIDEKGRWVTTGDYSGVLESHMKMGRLQVWSNEKDNSWSLKFSQWKKSIKAGEVNSMKTVEFKVVPAKFVKGHYTNSCSQCEAIFMGHKRQPICEKCCEENSFAQIVIKKNVEPSKPKKRQRLVHPTVVKDLAMRAYNKGVLKQCTREELETWLDKELS